MTREHMKDMLEAIGVITIVASLIFVALEIRTNTASNRISIAQTTSSNWLSINGIIAENHDLAELFEKGLAGEEMDRAEARQFRAFVAMHLTQSFHMLRLYDQGLISEDEVRLAFRALRNLAQRGRFRERLETTLSDARNRGLILDPDGLDKWLNIKP